MADESLSIYERAAQVQSNTGDGEVNKVVKQQISDDSDSSSDSDTDSSFSDSDTDTSTDTSTTPTQKTTTKKEKDSGGSGSTDSSTSSDASSGGSGQSFSRNPVDLVDRSESDSSGDGNTTASQNPAGMIDKTQSDNTGGGENENTGSTSPTTGTASTSDGETVDPSTDTPGPGVPDFDTETSDNTGGGANEATGSTSPTTGTTDDGTASIDTESGTLTAGERPSGGSTVTDKTDEQTVETESGTITDSEGLSGESTGPDTDTDDVSVQALEAGDLSGEEEDDGSDAVSVQALEEGEVSGEQVDDDAPVDRVIEERVPDDGDVLAGLPRELRDAGRTVLGEQSADEEVTDSLTEGEGNAPFTLTEEERETVNEDIEQRQEFFGVGDEAQSIVVDLTGSETAGNVAYGVGQAPGDIASATGGITLITDTGIRTVANTPEAVQEEGAADTGEAIANSITSTTRGGVEQFDEKPGETAGRVVGGFVAGAALTRGATAGRTKARGARVRLRADDTVNLEDITTDKGVDGGSPTFDTDTDADTQRATQELEERARDNPDAAKPGDSDAAFFHTTDSDISGDRGARNRVSNAIDTATPGDSTDIDVGEGGSELPGLFTSPDASGIGLDFASRTGSLKTALTRPRLRGGKSDQVVSVPGDDTRAMPDDATGSGYELRTDDGTVQERGLSRGEAKSQAEGTDLNVRPDSSTGGYKFLTEDADEGAIYTRPSGGRTSELEGIAPPGTKYTREGTAAVRMPGRSINIGGREIGIPGTGRTIPLKRFRRTDSDTDADADTTTTRDRDSDADNDGSGQADADTVTTSEVPSSRRRDVSPGQQTAAGGYAGSGLSTVFGGSDTGTGTGTTTTEQSPSSTADPTTPSDPTTPTSFDGITGGGSGTGTGTGGGSGGGTSTGPSDTSGGPSDGSGGPSGTPGGPSGTPGGSGGPSFVPGGSSTGGSGGGGGGGGGSGIFGGGTPTTGTPTTPTDPPNRPRDIDFPEIDNSKRDEEEVQEAGNAGEIITNFRNPLTGEVLETSDE